MDSGAGIEYYSASAQIAVVLALTLVIEVRADVRRVVRYGASKVERVGMSVTWCIVALLIVVAFSYSMGVLSGGEQSSKATTVVVAVTLTGALSILAFVTLTNVIRRGYFGNQPDVS